MVDWTFDFRHCILPLRPSTTLNRMDAAAGSYAQTQTNGHPPPRQLEKQPAQPSVALANITLDESKLDQEIALLVSQYLDSRSYGHIARVIDDEILRCPRREEREEIALVERAITGENEP